MTCEELINHVRNAVNGVEVHAADHRDVALALLRAGMTVAGIALDLLDEDEREYQLRGLEDQTRKYLAALAEAAWRRQSGNRKLN